MTIAVHLQGTESPELLTPLQFEQKMGVSYLSQLEFADCSFQSTIVRRCARAEKKHEINPRQKWLGSYYAQEISKGSHPSITIQWIDPTLGYGVFTNVPIPKNRYVGEYLGIVRKRPLLFRLSNLYCFDYTIRWGRTTPYVIDAKRYGNFTRYLNHSDRPNLEALSVFSDGVMHMIFYALTDIPQGAELCFNYGDKYWEKRGKPITF